MANLRIPIKVVKEVRKGMPTKDWKELKERLERFARDPYANHPGIGRFEDGWRVRHGDWRAICVENDNGEIEVIRVRHRVLSALAPDRLDEFAEAITRSGGCEDMEGNRCLPHVLPAPRRSRNILTHPGPAAEKVAQLVVASAIASG
jgi:mRNA-degrading endonuclease RelE of RelBE toxin-antitoxin system